MKKKVFNVCARLFKKIYIFIMFLYIFSIRKNAALCILNIFGEIHTKTVYYYFTNNRPVYAVVLLPFYRDMSKPSFSLMYRLKNTQKKSKKFCIHRQQQILHLLKHTYMFVSFGHRV